MAKYKVAVYGTPGRVITIDPDAGATLGSDFRMADGTLATAAKLREFLGVGVGSSQQHKELGGLQRGDDHPQYTMWTQHERIIAPWTFEETVTVRVGDVFGSDEIALDVINAGGGNGGAEVRTFSGGDSAFGNVVVLLHGDGADGGSVFTDSSTYGRTFTRQFGTATTSTSNPKFGTASIKELGSDFLRAAIAPELQVDGVADFTIECWFRPLFVGGGVTNPILRVGVAAGASPLRILIDAAGLLLAAGGASGGSDVFTLTAATALVVDTWNHIALVRSGTTYRLFLNGILQASSSSAVALNTGNAFFDVGSNQPASQFLNGYIDDFRFTNGTARYTANFSVPTQAFANVASNGVGNQLGFWADSGRPPGTSGTGFRWRHDGTLALYAHNASATGTLAASCATSGIWSFPTAAAVTGIWNFNPEPTIAGVTLTEFTQDLVGTMLLDTSSIDLVYNDTTGQMSAAIIDEYVQDLIGAMLLDTASVNLTYNDTTGQISADVLPAGVDHGGLGGLADDDHPQYPLAASTETISGAWTFTSASGTVFNAPSSAAATLSVACRTDTAAGLLFHGGVYGFRIGFSGAGTNFDGVDNTGFASYQQLTFGASTIIFQIAGTSIVDISAATDLRILRDNDELQIGAGQDLRLYHDGTNSIIENETGVLRIIEGATTVADFTAARLDMNLPLQLKNYTVATLPAGGQGDTAFVTDALAPAFLTAVVGGGAVVAPVFYDGTNWVAI